MATAAVAEDGAREERAMEVVARTRGRAPSMVEVETMALAEAGICALLFVASSKLLGESSRRVLVGGVIDIRGQLVYRWTELPMGG